MSLLEYIAPDLIVHILSEWIDWKDLSKFDVALCNRKLRNKYFRILQINHVNLHVNIIHICHFNIDSFLLWVNNRNMRLSKWKSSWSNYHALMQSPYYLPVTFLESLKLLEDYSTKNSADMPSRFFQVSQLPRLRELTLSTNDMLQLSIHNISPVLNQLSLLSLHISLLEKNELTFLSQNLSNIRVLTLHNEHGSSVDIIKILFFEHHLPLLESFSLTFSLLTFSEDDMKSLPFQQTKKLPHLKRLHVDTNSLLMLAPLAPNVTHINPLNFHKFAPYKSGFLKRLVGFCPKLIQLSLELQFIPSTQSTEVAHEISNIVIPTCSQLQSLSLCFGYDMMQYIWPVLNSVSEQLHQLHNVYFTYYKAKRASNSFSSMALMRTHIPSLESFSRWIRFWVTLFENNKELSHVEVRSLPFSVTEIASVARRLHTLILKHTTYGSPAAQQSTILRALGEFPWFHSLSRLEIQDDHITDPIARDILQSLASHCLDAIDQQSHHNHFRYSSLQKLTVLSHSITNQTLQALLYLPDEFAQSLHSLTFCAEYSVSFEPLLQRVTQRYCLPSGNVRKLHIVVDMDDSIRRQVIPAINKSLREKQRDYSLQVMQNNMAVTRFESPVVQDWREKKHSILLTSSR